MIAVIVLTLTFTIYYLFVVSAVHFAPYLKGFSSMMLIWAAEARCMWRAHVHNRMPWQSKLAKNDVLIGEITPLTVKKLVTDFYVAISTFQHSITTRPQALYSCNFKIVFKVDSLVCECVKINIQRLINDTYMNTVMLLTYNCKCNSKCSFQEHASV